MKVLGILGSPRIGGNADVLLEEALRGARDAGAETDKIILNRLKFRPCQECAGAPTNGACNVQDDMQEVFKRVAAADAVILASPVFFGSLSAQTKMFIDRYQCRWMGLFVHKTLTRAKIKKPGAFICVQGTDRHDFFENAQSIVKNLFVTIDARYVGDVVCTGVDDKGDAPERRDCLDKAGALGKRIATEEK